MTVRPCGHGYARGKCTDKDCRHRRLAKIKPTIDPLLQARALEIVALVAQEWGIEPASVLGPARYKQPAEARLVVYHVLRELGWSGPVIGAAVGGREHSLVYHGLSRLAVNMAVDPPLRARVHAVLGRLHDGAIPDLQVLA